MEYTIHEYAIHVIKVVGGSGRGAAPLPPELKCPKSR